MRNEQLTYNELNVLLIEDNPVHQFIFKEHFRNTSFNIDKLNIVETLKLGIKQLKQQSVDFLLLDLTLPDNVNLDGLRSIRKAFAKLPIIMLTSLDDQSMAIDAIRSGAQDYLVKGDFDGPLIERSMRYAMERKRQDEILRQSEQRMSAMINVIPDTLLRISKDGVCLDYKSSAVSPILNGKKLVDKNIDTFVPTELSKLLHQGVKLAIKTKKQQQFEYNFREEQLSFECRVVKSGKNEAYAIIRDITLWKKNETAILDAVVKAQDLERTRFSEDLHDGLGQLLFGIKLRMQAFRNNKEITKSQLAHLDQTISLLDESISSTRNISHNLMPPSLKDLGLESALNELFRALDDSEIFDLNFNSTLAIDKRFEPKIEIGVYRILLELINNTVKHGKATAVDIQLTNEMDYLFMRYSDNGIGIGKKITKATQDGMGLRNIYNRVKHLEGSIDFISAKSKGFKAELQIPLFNAT